MKIFISIALLLFVIQLSNGQQEILSRFGGVDQLPIIGACDRIAARGVANCMQNFLPTSLLSNLFTASEERTGPCCSFRKYSACITGLNDGLRIAMERAKCPRSYSSQIITSLGNGITVRPIAALCESFRGSCGKRKKGNSTNKPKRNNSPPVSESVLKPVKDIFSGFPSLSPNKPKRNNSPPVSESILKPVKDIFSGFPSLSPNKPNRNNSPPDSESILKPVQDIFSGFPSLSPNKPKRNNSPPDSESVLKPVHDLFAGFPSL